MNVPATFPSNPQFLLRLEDVDDHPLDGKPGCTFLVGLMQKNGRQQRRLNRDLETIGFAIYKVSQNILIPNIKSTLCMLHLECSVILLFPFYRCQMRCVFVLVHASNGSLTKTKILAAK